MTKNAVLKAIAAIGRKSAKFGGESVSVFRPAGSVNYLCGDTDRYDVDVSGYWYS